MSGCEKVEVAIRREKVEVASGRGGLGDLNAGQVPGQIGYNLYIPIYLSISIYLYTIYLLSVSDSLKQFLRVYVLLFMERSLLLQLKLYLACACACCYPFLKEAD